jgi:hypothetical protein
MPELFLKSIITDAPMGGEALNLKKALALTL